MPFEKIDFRSFDGAVIFPSRCCIKVKLAHKMKKANWLYPRGVSLSLCPRARCCWGFRPRSRWHLADGKSSSAQGTVAMATIHFNILKTTVKIFPVTGFNYLDFFSGDLATLQWHLPDGKSWGGCHGDDTLEHIKTVKIFPVLYFNYFDFFRAIWQRCSDIYRTGNREAVAMATIHSNISKLWRYFPLYILIILELYWFIFWSDVATLEWAADDAPPQRHWMSTSPERSLADSWLISVINLVNMEFGPGLVSCSNFHPVWHWPRCHLLSEREDSHDAGLPAAHPAIFWDL